MEKVIFKLKGKMLCWVSAKESSIEEVRNIMEYLAFEKKVRLEEIEVIFRGRMKRFEKPPAVDKWIEEKATEIYNLTYYKSFHPKEIAECIRELLKEYKSWRLIKKPHVTEEWIKKKALELIDMTGDIMWVASWKHKKANDFIRSLVEELKGGLR